MEQENKEYDFSNVNRLGIFCYGYTPAFCSEDYTLLTPECIWYPVSVPPYSPLEYRKVNFTRYSLTVEHEPRLVVISQGDTVDEKEGKTSFVFTHDMPGISLCVGEYRKREVTVASMGGRLIRLVWNCIICLAMNTCWNNILCLKISW